MTPAEALVERTTVAQGLPERLVDPAIIARAVDLLQLGGGSMKGDMQGSLGMNIAAKMVAITSDTGSVSSVFATSKADAGR
jgi:hypothetical protein